MELVAHFSAPGRAGLVGNPTDIYGGKVISSTIAARNHCRLYRMQKDSPLAEDRTLIEAAAKMRSFDCGNYLFQLHTEVPRSSGLAGSTAMLASILACIDVAQGSFVETSAAFAEDVRRCEREFANIVCGYQDAYMVTFGGFRIGDYLGKHPVRSGPTAVLRSLPYQIPLLLVSTGRQRLSGSVHGPLAERWLAGEALVQKQIESISSLPDAALSAMMRSDWLELGQIMNENQAATRLLGGSGEEIDKLVELCIRHGALGAKLAGAGHGGTVIALHPNPNELELVLRNLGYRSFNRVLPQAGLVRHDVR